MKLGLALAGGGSKGSYEVGALNALFELGYYFDVVTGTSIGALNGALIAQKQLDALNALWDNIEPNQILKNDVTQLKVSFDLDEIVQTKNLLTSFFKDYAKELGADITPFYDLINHYLDFNSLQQSDIEFGCVTVEFPSLKPVLTSKKDYDSKETAFNYLLASASCFPAFPKAQFNNKKYIDGGYYDNLPIQYCFQLGADEVIAIDLKPICQHPTYLNHPLVQLIVPSWDLGSFLDFNKEHIKRNKRLGYLDIMKRGGCYYGFKYAFKNVSSVGLLQNYAKALLRFSMIDEIDYIQSCWYQPLNECDYAIIVLEQLMQWFNYDPCIVYDMDEILTDATNYYHWLLQQKLDLAKLEDLVKNYTSNELYLLVLKHMIEKQDISVDLGIASKLISSQLMPLHCVTLLVLMLLNQLPA